MTYIAQVTQETRIPSSEEVSMYDMASLFNYNIQKSISRMACWPGERLLACHVVDLQLSLLICWPSWQGLGGQSSCMQSTSGRKCRMMLTYDHFFIFTLGKHTYEIPAKYGYTRHFVNVYLQFEFEPNLNLNQISRKNV